MALAQRRPLIGQILRRIVLLQIAPALEGSARVDFRHDHCRIIDNGAIQASRFILDLVKAQNAMSRTQIRPRMTQ